MEERLDNDMFQEEKILEEEDAEGISIERYAFNSFKIERSIRDILNWVEKEKIIIPEFQRDFVWTFNQSCKLIESVLLGLPIPDFFMFRIIDSEMKTERYILIDGLQRYTAIKQFVEGYYKQGDIKRRFAINDKSSKWYKKEYKSLEEEDKDYFADYSLKINVFDSVEPSEKIQKLYMTSIFERINTGSTKLSGQEVRNAIYSGKVITLLKKCAKAQDFQLLLQDDKKRYSQRCKNEEFYLRLLTYNQVYKQYTNHKIYFIDEDPESKISTSKELMLCNYLYYSNKDIINYNKDCEEVNQIISKIVKFNDTAFCTVKRENEEVSNRIHELFSEALVIALLNGAEITITKEKFDEQKLKIWKNAESYSEFFVSTTNLENVKKRVDTIKRLLSGEEL